MLLWSDAVVLMILSCCTNVASVCPGVVQSHITRSPRNCQIINNSLHDCVHISASDWNLIPPSLLSVLLTHNPRWWLSGLAYRWVPFAHLYRWLCMLTCGALVVSRTSSFYSLLLFSCLHLGPFPIRGWPSYVINWTTIKNPLKMVWSRVEVWCAGVCVLT